MTCGSPHDPHYESALPVPRGPTTKELFRTPSQFLLALIYRLLPVHNETVKSER